MARKSQVTIESVVDQAGKVVSAKRSVEQIIKLWLSSSSVEQLDLTPSEIIQLIDIGSEIEDRRRDIDKEVKKQVEPIKEILRNVAEAQKWRHKEGRTGDCKVGSSTKTIPGTATELSKLLKKEGKSKLLNSLLTIRITDAKKFLGEDVLFGSGFFKSERIDYSNVTLKGKEKK